MNLVINNARIIDGTGLPPYIGSIFVDNDRIAGVHKNPWLKVNSDKVIDAKGKVLSPGFIDTHTHSDMILLHDGKQVSSLSQGVTTEIIGQDGLSYAPLSTNNLISYTKYLRGINGQFNNVDLDFNSVDAYLNKLNKKISVNVAYLVPHCALRLETVGFSDMKLQGNDMIEAKKMLISGIRQGAKGFSTGLSYYPASFSDTNELIDICRAVAEENGVFAIHLRTVFRDKSFNNIDEAIKIAKESKVKLHFSHYRTGGSTIGNTKLIMHKIDRAIEEGVDISLELYPYPYGASFAPMLIPMWAHKGDIDSILSLMAKTETRKEIANDIDRNFSTLDGIISFAGENPELTGNSFSELARERNVSIGTLLSELLYTQKLALGFREKEPVLDSNQRGLFEKDVFALLSRPNYMVGSDAIHIGNYPHPRAYGSFTKLLRLSNQYHFPLETLINRITDVPCKRFGIKERGLLKKGYYADMVLFDSHKVTDTSSVYKPRNLSKGIKYVWVNGSLVFQDGNITGALTGRIV